MNIKKFLIFIMITILIGGFGLIFSPKIISANGSPNEVWVDDDYNSSTPGWGYDHFDKIQDGVNAVTTSGTVHVLQGTYNESVTINKSLSLIGDPGDSNPGPGTNAPILDGTGFSGKRAFSIANNVTSVVIRGFIVQNFGPNGNTECNGVTAWCPYTANITIEDNYFYNLGYSGILTGNGWGGTQGLHDNWVIRNNVVDTTGAYGFDIENAKNTLITNNVIKNIPWYGINVLSLTTENGANIISENNEVSYNTFENVNFYNINLLSWSTNSTATSILRNINVHHNTINSSVSSIIAWKTGSGNLSIENITINNNTININNPTGTGYVINLNNVSGISRCNYNNIYLSGSIGGGGTFFHGINIGESSTDTWYIENNILNGNNVGSDSVGIRIRGSLPSTSILNITNNEIFNWSNGVRSDSLPSGIDVNVNYNEIINNSNYGVLNGTGELIDATYNWWGDESGPSGVASGNGDAISDNVDYSPWLVPNISITKTDSPDPVAQGMPLTYTINWNMGSTWNTWDGTTLGTTNVNIPSSITFDNVLVKDYLPGEVTFVSCTGGGTFSSGVATWNLGPYTPGTSGSLTVNTNVNLSAPNGQIENRVDIIYDSLIVSDSELTTIQEGAGGVYNFYDPKNGAFILLNTSGTGWRVVIPSRGYDTGWISFRRFVSSGNHFWGEYSDTRYKFIIDFYSPNRYHIIFYDRVGPISIKIAN